MSVLLIGIGNTLRGDDAAGIQAAQRLHTAWQGDGCASDLILTHQLVPELAEDLANPVVEVVIFVDAARESASAPLNLPGGALLWRAYPHEGMAAAHGLNHVVSPALLLAYAAELYAAQPDAWVLGLPGERFSLGADLSTQTSIAIADLVARAGMVWRVVNAIPASTGEVPR